MTRPRGAGTTIMAATSATASAARVRVSTDRTSGCAPMVINTAITMLAQSSQRAMQASVRGSVIPGVHDDGMKETEAEIEVLQTLLDTSLSRSTGHLRSIVTPGERNPSARQMVGLLSGMCVLAIATVTSRGEPRISAVDGFFWHGKWLFGTARGAAKARQLEKNPAVSVAHLRGEELGVFTHGHARVLNPVSAAEGEPDPQWPEIHEFLRKHYKSDPLELGDVIYYRLDPTWMVCYGARAG
jgi:Pyridoxamine 5'-phosphate oxidase